jgi:ribosomal protein S1
MQKKQESRLDRLRSELAEALGAPRPASNLYSATVAGASPTASDVVLELVPRDGGPAVQGIVPREEFPELPAVGGTVSVALVGREEDLWIFSAREGARLATWEEMDVGSTVEGQVIGVNKGGLELKVSGVNAFLPASQIALGHVEDLVAFAGQRLVCRVVEIDRSRKRVVLSRRAILEEERELARGEAAGSLRPGTVVRGKVVRLESFGAFVELGAGLEGLLHVSNLAHRRVEHPSELLAVGQELELQVLEVSQGGKRIGLGRKQLETDPWSEVATRFQAGDVVQGRVRRLVEFGAFVELVPGVEGLLHISEIGAGRVRQAREALSVGQEVTVRIVSVDPHARRLSLSQRDPRGAVLGSEDSAGSAEIAEVLEERRPAGTNLGKLFQQALDKRKG